MFSLKFLEIEPVTHPIISAKLIFINSGNKKKGMRHAEMYIVKIEGCLTLTSCEASSIGMPNICILTFTI